MSQDRFISRTLLSTTASRAHSSWPRELVQQKKPVQCGFLALVFFFSTAATDIRNCQSLGRTAIGAEKEVSGDSSSTDTALKQLIEKLKAEEARFHSYSAKTRHSRHYNSSQTADPNNSEAVLTCITTLGDQTVHGERFHFQGEDLVTYSKGEPQGRKGLTVFDGVQTVAIEAGLQTTIYQRRAEPPQMRPPHCWGIFHLGVGFPLSVYLSGTEVMQQHPKVGRHPHEAGSNIEFGRTEAEIVGHESIDDLDCVVLRVKRWYYSNSPPVHQYLWLASDRNLHVVLSRTASLDNQAEVPLEESRVTKWRELAEGVWVPEIVEVVSLAPAATRNKPSLNRVAEFVLESASWNPVLIRDTFQLPETTADLPRFVVSKDHRLVDSPHHPVPLAPGPSSTLSEILDRLSEDEEKYSPGEVILHRDYVLANVLEGMPGLTLKMRSRKRSVISGARSYFESENHSISHAGESTSIHRQADDGTIRRSMSTSIDSQQTRRSAAINQTRNVKGDRFDRDRLLDIPRHLSQYLKLGSFEPKTPLPIEVEYSGDERIDDLVCHRLKCVQNGQTMCYWLARDRNLLPIRFECYEPAWHATLPTAIHIATEIQEVCPALWFPRRSTELAFQTNSRDGMTNNRLQLQWRRDTVVDAVTWKPEFHDKLFSELIVPAGTLVNLINEFSVSLGQFTTSDEENLEFTPARLQEVKKVAAAARDPGLEVVAGGALPASFKPSRARGDSTTALLLNRLEYFNGSKALFKTSWLRTIKEIAELGSDAIPDLIDELDATNDDRMLRCLGFILRSIDDKRSVPALIRAIPKTLRRPGSDMGLNTDDPALLKFAQEHDLNPAAEQSGYDFGRPVREICGALEKLTGQQFNEGTLYRQFLSGLPPDWRQKRQQYYDVASSWAEWWERHAAEYVDDPAAMHVNLAPVSLATPPRKGARVETIGEKSGLILQSVMDPKAQNVFYDIETDRFAAVPEEWRVEGKIAAQLANIIEWAQKEGFDLMGSDYPGIQPTDKPTFAIRGVGLKSWELDPGRWKQQRDAVTLELLTNEGRLATGFLLRRNKERPSQIDDPLATASFFAITSEQSPVLLQIGVEVQDDRPKPGHFHLDVPESNPVGPMKGRRFSVMYLNEMD